MPLSIKTKTALSQRVILAREDLFPDREATPSGTSTYDIRDVGATVARLPDEIPSTTKDMSALYKWECGDDLYGTHAKSSPVLKRIVFYYINTILTVHFFTHCQKFLTRCF